jgi:hypothetical protein
MLSARGADPASIVLFNRCINGRNIEALTHLMTDDHTFIDTEGNAVSGRQGVGPPGRASSKPASYPPTTP